MPDTPTVPLPVARVAVDVSLAHLDRPFDYRVGPAEDEAAVPGARVRVRFAGRLRDGFVLERLATSDSDRELSPLSKVISSEPVLAPEIATLVRSVADHYAGCFADVQRLAVPPRHAATEKAEPAARPPLPDLRDSGSAALAAYRSGSELVDALRSGGIPRAYWQVIPATHASGDWADGFAAAARATVDSCRSAVLVVPDQRDLATLRSACTRVLGRTGFVVLTAEAGPAARYRAFLAALRGDVRVVIGNRAAAYAPVRDLGLVALWDDGDDLLAEQRAPYPHTRTVLALRASQQRTGVLFAGYGRSCEAEQLLRRGWLSELSADRTQTRHTAPRVRVTVDSDQALARDPAARSARLPHEVFELIRATLPQGPVLVQVPRAGYLIALVCQDCREPARCRRCHGPLRLQGRGSSASRELACGWCGLLHPDWECPICGGRRLRAPVVGAERTAEELGRAFPNTVIRQSSGSGALTDVPGTPALVVATPGAEPVADGGYAGAVLLDTSLLLLRADLRAAEEALRRWLAVIALVRPGADGGSVIAAGDSTARVLQALVRLDPAGFAARELAERAEAHFPPAAKVITLDGGPAALADVLELLRPPDPYEVLGPVPQPSSGAGRGTAENDDEIQRLTLRTPLTTGSALVRAVKEVTGVRSARKSEGALRVRVDPAVLG